MTRPAWLPDNFTLSLLAVVVAASAFPASGGVALFFERLTAVAIGFLFFLHGARLSREAILGGITHWRLHLVVFAATFTLFPVMGLVLRPLLEPLVTPALYTGVLYLCVLPATVQSAIAFVSLARGNVPAAICSASASTLVGVFATPLLVGLVVMPGASAEASFGAIGRILLQLMLPFTLGHLLRPLIGRRVQKHAPMLKLVDQGAILLVVFTAFSAAVIEGLWMQVPASALLGLLVVCAILLAAALLATTWLARRLGSARPMRSPSFFAAPRKAWPAACRWPRSSSPPARSVRSSCRSCCSIRCS